MKIQAEQLLLRIFLRTTDQTHWAPTYQRLVQAASHRKMAGATVLKGVLGFGAAGVLHDSGLSLSDNEPVVVELVDQPAAIGAFIEESLDKMLLSGMATVERAHVVMYRREPDSPERIALAPPIVPLSTIPALRRSGHMNEPTDGVLLRIFIGESDESAPPQPGPLYKAIVLKARELGLKGATVLRGSMGFGANSVLHTSKVLELSTDLPMVIEIVDKAEHIAKILPFLEATILEGMITVEDVRILSYGARQA